MAPPRKYKSDAERVAAFRARRPMVQTNVDAHIAQTLDEIAAQFEVPRAAVIESMLKFALTNRDWKRLGLTHTKKP